MSRRHRADKRDRVGDERFGNTVINRMINTVMERGKKSVAQGVVYGALEQVAETSQKDALEVFQQALDNIKPQLEVKSRRVGGATYQVPVEVSQDRQESLAMRWIIDFARGRKGVPMGRALALEILDAAKNQGNAVKKREDTHKMAQANRAFAHYRW
jgi:small subunit ribosomal protein S7